MTLVPIILVLAFQLVVFGGRLALWVSSQKCHNPWFSLFNFAVCDAVLWWGGFFDRLGGIGP